MEKVERVQYQAALVITGAWQGSNRSKLYEELGWESLSDRRWCRRILQIYKIINSNTPCYLKNKLPRIRRPLYSQINCNTFHKIRCNSFRYMHSFFLMVFLLGIISSPILKSPRLLVSSKIICYLFFVPTKNIFSEFMILRDFGTFFS